MTDDQTFRLVLLVLAGVFLPIGLYHRLRAQATGESLDRRQEGLFILIALRLLALLAFLGVVAWLIDPAWMTWSAIPLPVWARWCGVGLMLAGGLMGVWTFRHLGVNITDTVVTRREHTLITSGPYRWVRHPFYVTGFIGVAGLALTVANWFVAVVSALVLALLVVRTTTEEAFLVARFGDDYRAYAARTGRFFPRWWS